MELLQASEGSRERVRFRHRHPSALGENLSLSSPSVRADVLGGFGDLVGVDPFTGDGHGVVTPLKGPAARDGEDQGQGNGKDVLFLQSDNLLWRGFQSTQVER